jgi:hypothetical protein
MTAPVLKWSMTADGQWVLRLFIRDGKGDRPADNINQSKEGRK